MSLLDEVFKIAYTEAKCISSITFRVEAALKLTRIGKMSSKEVAEVCRLPQNLLQELTDLLAQEIKEEKKSQE